MIPSSRPELVVVGVFNPAVIRHEREVILLLRVAEAPRDVPEGEVAAPVYDQESGLSYYNRDRSTSRPRPRLLAMRAFVRHTSVNMLGFCGMNRGSRRART